MVANYYKPGPATRKDVSERIVEAWKSSDRNGVHDYGKFYIAGNCMHNNEKVTKDNWEGVDIRQYSDMDRINEAALGAAYDSLLHLVRANESFPYEIEFTQPAEDAFISVLAHAGASYRRDIIDARIVKETETGTATFGGSYGKNLGIIDSQKTVGGWPELKSEPPPADSDHDGIPDAWEKQNGLNPHNPGDAMANTLNGNYNNIEVYLNPQMYKWWIANYDPGNKGKAEL